MKLNNIILSVLVGGLVTSATLLLLNTKKKQSEVLPSEPKLNSDQESLTQAKSDSNHQMINSSKNGQKGNKQTEDEEYYKGFKVYQGAKGGRYYINENGTKKYLKPKK